MLDRAVQSTNTLDGPEDQLTLSPRVTGVDDLGDPPVAHQRAERLKVPLGPL